MAKKPVVKTTTAATPPKKKRKLSLGGKAVGSVDPFARPMRKHTKWRMIKRDSIRSKNEKKISRAEYWMEEYRLQIVSLGGVLAGASVPFYLAGKITPAMTEAKLMLKERARNRADRAVRKLSLGG